jgi:hypothetical protein
MVIAIYLKAKIKGTKYIEKNSLCIFVLFTNSLLCHLRITEKEEKIKSNKRAKKGP